MNRKPAAIPHASQAIEDLLKESTIGANQQGWLLSYLDVFILIVMLLITLNALTDINAGPAPKTRQNDTPVTVNLEKQPEPQTQNQSNAISLAPNNEAISNTGTETSAMNWINIANTGEEMIFIFAPLKSAVINIDPDFAHKIEPIYEPQPDHTGHQELLTTITKAPQQAQQQLTGSITTNSETETQQMHSAAVQETVGEKETIEQPQVDAMTEQQHNDEQRQKKLNERLAKLQLDELISMEVKQGYAQLQIQDNILFEVAQAELTQQGKSLLQSLLPLLQQSVGLIFIEGHTDDRPIATDQFPSNWELSAARATSVLRFLASQQLAKHRLRAVSYADTMPIADNDTAAGRSQNRRVSILLRIPDDEL